MPLNPGVGARSLNPGVITTLTLHPGPATALPLNIGVGARSLNPGVITTLTLHPGPAAALPLNTGVGARSLNPCDPAVVSPVTTATPTSGNPAISPVRSVTTVGIPARSMVTVVSATHRPFSVILFMIVQVIVIVNICKVVVRPVIVIVGPDPETHQRGIVEIVIIITMIAAIITRMINQRIIVMIYPVQHVASAVEIQFYEERAVFQN